jgi:hypothetical protein
VPGRTLPIAVAAQNTDKTAAKSPGPGHAVFLSWSDDAVIALEPD